MTSPETLMTIGDFSREAGLAPKALRLYNDPRLVATLRLLGMPVARITQVLDQGGRALQQDAFIATPALVAVADGFGDSDDVAAAALAAFATGGLDEAISEIAPVVSAALPAPPSSGTTLTAVVIEAASARITHIGDARVWVVRDGEVQQVTYDHTVVAGLLEAGS